MSSGEDHMYRWSLDNTETENDRAWDRWIDAVSELLGRDPDGDQERDGYSLDNFYNMWKGGYIPQKAVQNKGTLF